MNNIFGTFSIRKFDFILVFLVVALNSIGVAAIGSAAPALQNRYFYGMLAGLFIMVCVCIFDYTLVLKIYWILYLLSISLLILVLAFGSTGNGAQRWVRIAGVTVQPSELVKILLILFFAKFIMKYKSRMKSIGMVAVCLVFIFVPVILVYKQPDMSTSIMLFVIFAVMMFVGGISYKLVAGVLAVFIPSVIIFISLVVQEGSTLIHSYQRDRIMAWLHPENYETTTAYQTLYSIMAIGSGQLQGKGYDSSGFSSLLNNGYISESQTDFIFTVIGEEFGFIGACSTVILLICIALRCFTIARSAKDVAGSVIASGVGAWIGFQGFMNIGVVTGVLPNTGIPLPFVSYGLTSLLCLYVGIGFVLNVSMQRVKPGSVSNRPLHGGPVYEYSTYRA